MGLFSLTSSKVPNSCEEVKIKSKETVVTLTVLSTLDHFYETKFNLFYMHYMAEGKSEDSGNKKKG